MVHSTDFDELMNFAYALHLIGLRDISPEIIELGDYISNGCNVPVYDLSTWQLLKLGLAVLSEIISGHREFPRFTLQIQEEVYAYNAEDVDQSDREP